MRQAKVAAHNTRPRIYNPEDLLNQATAQLDWLTPPPSPMSTESQLSEPAQMRQADSDIWINFNNWRYEDPNAYELWLQQLHLLGHNPQQNDINDNESVSSPGTQQVRVRDWTVGNTPSDLIDFNQRRAARRSLIEQTQATTEPILRTPSIHRPPTTLALFCKLFHVPDRHTRMLSLGVRVWPNATHVKRKPATEPTPLMDHYMAKLLRAGVIELSSRGPFVANCFILPKKNGEARLVIDYSALTPVLRPPRYYLPSVYQVIQRQVFPFHAPYFVKIDLKNAFFNLPLHPKSRYLTTFHYGADYFRFTKMPFGLSLAPFVQQMMGNPIAAMFRKFGLYSWIHVDDLIAAHEDRYYLFVVCAYVTDLLRKSGVRVNREKSVLIPRTSLEFLGAIWSQNAIERAPHITKTINTLIFRMATQPLTLKQVEQASGFLNYYISFAGIAYPFITFFMRHWQSIRSCQWYFPLLFNIFNIKKLFYNSGPSILASRVHPLVCIHCDASETGVAAVQLDGPLAFHYNIDYAKPIYVKEFEACALAFKLLRTIIKNTNYRYNRDSYIEVATDNLLVYFLLNRGHGHFRHIAPRTLLNFLFIFIYINRFIVPVNVVYVPSAENQADGLSRL